MKTNLEVLEIWFRRVWNEGDVSAIEEMFVPDGKARGLGSEVLLGPEGFKEFHRHFFHMMKDFDIKVELSADQDGWIHALCILHATSRKTDNPVTMTGTVVARIDNGQLVEAHNHWDFIGLFGQLGLMPADSIEKCLCGEGIA